MNKNHNACALISPEELLRKLQSEDAAVRACAVRSLCPCRLGWTVFEAHLAVVSRLTKDPDKTVRAAALHVFEDAGEMQSEGYPTHPREATDELLRTRRASRFRPDDDDLQQARRAREKPGYKQNRRSA